MWIRKKDGEGEVAGGRAEKVGKWDHFKCINSNDKSHCLKKTKKKNKSTTYNLCLRASEVEEHHANAVVWWHPEALKGLLEQNTFSDTHFLCEQCETLIDVHSQGALLPIPAARWGKQKRKVTQGWNKKSGTLWFYSSWLKLLLK